MTRTEQFIRTAIEKGYYIDKDGILWRDCSPVRPRKPRNGYLTFTVAFKEGNKNVVGRCPLHKLQAFQKYGDKIFEKGIVCRHLNDVKLDNSYDNIAIGTHRDNFHDIPAAVRSARIYLMNKKANRSKYDHAQIIEDRANGMSIKEIAEKHGIGCPKYVSKLLKNCLLVRHPERVLLANVIEKQKSKQNS